MSDEDARTQAQRDLDYVAEKHPVLMEALLEVKACVLTHTLPDPGTLDDQTCGYGYLIRWLAAKGILEGLVRASLG